MSAHIWKTRRGKQAKRKAAFVEALSEALAQYEKRLCRNQLLDYYSMEIP